VVALIAILKYTAVVEPMSMQSTADPGKEK